MSFMPHIMILLGGCCWLAGQAAEPPVWFPGSNQDLTFFSVELASKPDALPLENKDPEKAGIDFINRLNVQRSLKNQILLNGSGLAIGDVNGDDLPDLYFCGLDTPNALYLNQGEWSFERAPQAGGAECADQSSTGALLADMDGDDDLDLLVTAHRRGVRLFLNNGSGLFEEGTYDWGLAGKQAGASMALGDIQGNGWLDLYVVHYRNDTLRDLPEGQFDIRMKDGKYELLSYNGLPANDPRVQGRFHFDRTSGILENGEPDQLYLNRGEGKMTAIRWGEEVFFDRPGEPSKIPYDWGLSAMLQDINGDGAPDLYVCNDFQSPDRFWINQKDGTFLAALPPRIKQTSLFSMGLDMTDVDRNGHRDLFVVDMLSRSHHRRLVQVMDGAAFQQFRDTRSDLPQTPRNTLFMQQAKGHFAELARFADVAASEWSWCPVFIDLDLDGYEDLLITTGHERDAQNADVARSLDAMATSQSLPHPQKLASRRAFPVLDTPNMAFRNLGDGRFEEVSKAWGFDSKAVSHGMALGDLDNDGDMDVVINPLNHPALLYQNQSDSPRVRIQLEGLRGNTKGIGAEITVLAPHLPIQKQSVIAGGRYLSSDQPTRTFAVQGTEDRVSVHILWRDGVLQKADDLKANHVYRFTHPGKDAQKTLQQPTLAEAPKGQATTLFKNVSEKLEHIHEEAPQDPSTAQPLLPRQLDGMGPGIAWFDFNQDGWEDLFIGGGRGGKMGVYRNQQGQSFVRQRAKAFERPLAQDQTTLLAWRPSNQDMQLLMGQSSIETPAPQASAFTSFSMVNGQSLSFPSPAGTSSGPMAMADWDGDGDLDLFVGGRVRPGHYPTPASSQWYQNQDGRWVAVTMPVIEDLSSGMVSAAVFTQLLGDALPELVIACEWGEVIILENRAGAFRRWEGEWHVTKESKSPIKDPWRGWWTSLASLDADGDGRMDLVAGNWGVNHQWAHSRFSPLEIYFPTQAPAGIMPLIESYRTATGQESYPTRDWGHLSSSIPWLGQAFNSFTEFSLANMTQILSSSPTAMESLAVSYFESVLLLNRGDHFLMRPLPTPVQWSPLFGVGVSDFNGDGHEDLVGSQNFYGVSERDSRQDAGEGFLLLGKGDGTFEWVDSILSGIDLPGEGRGLAVADFNKDHRPDFVAIQRLSQTRVWENQGGKPGITLKLTGTDGNLQAIGTRVRWIYGDGSKGPMREIHLGEGYWSQSSTRPILGMAKEPRELEIHWPGGISEIIALTQEHLKKRLMVLAHPSRSP